MKMVDWCIDLFPLLLVPTIVINKKIKIHLHHPNHRFAFYQGQKVFHRPL